MSARVASVPVSTAVLDRHLPGWDYADAYEIAVDATGPGDALSAARSVLGSGSGRRLLRVRDRLVRGVGLRPAVTGTGDLFPVLVDTPELAVLGLDDAHLDFRVLVSLQGRGVRCVTVVRRHNTLGFAYFAVVRPFHRWLVPYLLVRAARRGWTPADPTGPGPGARRHAVAEQGS